MKKEELELRKAFYNLEKQYRPYFDVLTENQDIYPEYTGAITLDGYLNYKPDILFLGYNPAHGKYRDWNKDGAHLVYTGERPFGFFEVGNARKNGRQWWETNQARGNSFPANIIDFLYQYVAESGIDSEYQTFKRPKWSNGIESKIMAINIYPIATKSSKELMNLFKKMINNKAIPEIKSCEEEWDIRKIFIHQIQDFIADFIKPKAILCIGTQTISDYTWGKFQKKEGGIMISPDHPNMIGISRSGTWNTRAKIAAKLIADIVKQYN